MFNGSLFHKYACMHIIIDRHSYMKHNAIFFFIYNKNANCINLKKIYKKNRNSFCILKKKKKRKKNLIYHRS